MSVGRFHELVHLCPAIESESPSSWITRAALGQGTSIRRLAEHLGWVSWGDIDLSFAAPHSIGLTEVIPTITGLEVARRLMAGFRESRCPKHKMLLSKEGKCRYRFCPHCLRSDSTPYMRQHWRFCCWHDCINHQCLLNDACPHCDAAIQLPLSLHNAGPQRKRIPDLSHCARCGRSLTEAVPRDLALKGSDAERWQQMRLRAGRAAITAMYEGWLQLPGEPYRRPLNYLRLLERCGRIPLEI